MPDNTDRERILLLENNHKVLMDKIESILERFDKFEEKLDKALEKKADIWVEKALSWALYSVAAIIIGAFMYLIVKFKL